MIEGYIVVGHEGLEKIVGLFDKDDAISRVIEIRKLCGVKFEIPDAGACSDEEWGKIDWDKDFEHILPEQICVMQVNSNGSKCVCKELGVSTGCKPWLY